MTTMVLPATATVVEVLEASPDAVRVSEDLCDLLDEADLDYDRVEMVSALEIAILNTDGQDAEDRAVALIEVMQDRLW